MATMTNIANSPVVGPRFPLILSLAESKRLGLVGDHETTTIGQRCQDPGFIKVFCQHSGEYLGTIYNPDKWRYEETCAVLNPGGWQA